MTHHHDERVNALERALVDAYRSQSSSAGDVDVTQTVMREIRRSGAARGRWAAATVLDQLVWRTATITAAVVLMAALLTVGLLRTPAGDSPSLVAEEFESVPLFED
jgi:anti-sigma factor RsiW